MRRLSSNQILQVLLILALVVNAVIHFTSPSYRYYRENIEDVKKGVREFENKVKFDFVPSIIAVATNRPQFVFTNGNSSASGTSASGTSLSGSRISGSDFFLSSSNDLSRLFSLDFHYFNAGGFSGFELDSHYYYIGDSFFGSTVRSITPTIIVTDDYQFVKPLIGKFSLESSVTVTPVSSSPSPSVSNPSHVVRQLPDVFNPVSFTPVKLKDP